MTVRAFMRRWISQPVALLVVFAAVSVVFAACGRDGVSEPETATTNLTVVPNTARIPVGASQQLSARGGSGRVGWSSSNPAVATVEFGRVVATGVGTATIRAISGSVQATARITVIRPPLVELQPTGLGFSAYTGGAIPGEQSATVTNGGDVPLGTIGIGTITYGGGSSGWLTVTVTQATDGATITVRPNTTALANGVHTASIPLTSADNTAPSLNVTYTVTTPPAFALTQTSVTFSAQRTTALPAEQPIAVTNIGGAPLTGVSITGIAYGPGASGWLTATLDGTAAPTTLRLRPNTTAPVEGTYTATVTLGSALPAVAPIVVNVSYTISAAPTPPRIVLNPENVTFNVQQGNPVPVSQNVSITNGGQVALTGLARSIEYISGATGWLNASAPGATAPTNMTLQPNTVPGAGTHTARVIVSSPVAIPTTDTVLVTYNVTLPPQICVSTTSVSFTVTADVGGTRSTNVNVSNCGGGTLTGLTATIAYNSGSGWMTRFLASNPLPAGSSTPLTITVGVIPPGTVTGTVTVSATGVTSRVINVSFTRIATWSGDVWGFLNARCLGCHGAGNTAGNENISFFDVNTSYTQITTRNSVDHGTKLVNIITANVLGDSTSSYFFGQVKRTAPSFSDDYMPPGCTTTCLTTEQVRIVGVWIQQGARRDP